MTSLPRRARRVAFCTVLVALSVSVAEAQHQTPGVDPIHPEDALPYRISLEQVPFPTDTLAGLHSMVQGQWQGEWVFVSGRSNGLHDLTAFGLASFPPRFQNREVWVVNPETKQVWHRSLAEATSGLSPAVIDSLTPTNAQAFQRGSRLYMSGGYGFNAAANRFQTFDRLTSFDLPQLIEWTKGASASPDVTGAIRQISGEIFRVTGGEMDEIDGVAHLVFGQNFDGPYNPFASGVYTNQVRSFRVLDDELGLRVEDVALSPEDPAFRRRDLNVLPIITRDGDELHEGLVAFSGVFTESDGAWTVPVEIDSDGVPTMADPESPAAFKQGMNNYTSAAISVYSEAADEMHSILMGGISLQYYDEASQSFVTDNALPFINQITSVVRSADGTYAQYLLSEEFPELYDGDGLRLRFGTNAAFMQSPDLAAYDNGVIKFDELDGPTLLGYVYGGIASNAGHNGASVASNAVFRVVLTPTNVPEPTGFALAVVSTALLAGARHPRAQRALSRVRRVTTP